MPLMAKFISYERQGCFIVGKEVEAGKVGVWEDKSIYLGAYIVARCFEKDMGAEVFIIEDTYRDDEGRLIIPFADVEPDEIILPGLTFQKDIIDYENESGRLIIQHIMSGDKINSVN